MVKCLAHMAVKIAQQKLFLVMMLGEFGQYMKVINTSTILLKGLIDARNLVSTAVYSSDPAVSFTILVDSPFIIGIQLLGGSNLAAADKMHNEFKLQF